MPLSKPSPRQHLHTREITLRGYQRDDGLFEIEADLLDTKTHPVFPNERGEIKPGEPIHKMAARMTYDANLTIVAFEAALDYGPYQVCPAATSNFAKLAGLSITRGFLKAAAERVGGTAGCTHLREMLQQMGTVALQTLHPIRMKDRKEEEKRPDYRPASLNTCYGWSSDHPRFAKWPHLYTGKPIAGG
jgi:hypothetical protein